MNQEFIDALNEIEKEKGISKEIVFEALESALVSCWWSRRWSTSNIFRRGKKDWPKLWSWRCI